MKTMQELHSRLYKESLYPLILETLVIVSIGRRYKQKHDPSSKKKLDLNIYLSACEQIQTKYSIHGKKK